MVFSSIPVYVDPPNWHQQQPNHQHQHQHQHHHQLNGSDNTHLLPPLPPLAAEMAGGGGGSMGSIRPGSMADRARLAKIPPPEPALKCPRCNSTNTKFCYFNNYSLSQPRHFCKACRRYWTSGGALRNVPVGGGCRRNKKSKRSRSKSPSSSEKQTPSSSANNNNSIPSTHEMLGQLPPQPPTLPFMASLQNLSRYGVGNMGLRMGENIHQGQNDHMGFQIGGVGNSVSGGGVEQWRLQQFPFLNGFESTTSPGSNYPFQSEGNIDGASDFVGDLASSSRVTQVPPVKMEDNGGLNLSRSSLNNVSENNQYFSWTDMSGLASSSTTSHLL